MICWSCFTWDAAATLLTGLAAVGAALWVGLKQVEIVGRQVKLQEATLKERLFERRMEVVLVHAGLSSEALATQRVEAIQSFYRVRDTVKYLFSERVHELLDEAYELSIDWEHDRDNYLANRPARTKNIGDFREAVRPYLTMEY